MNVKNIYLVGMPGSGKSYWGQEIAFTLSRRFIDLDDIIQVRTGLSVAQYFGRFGEAAFRRLESQTLQQVMTVFPEETVIACGGGTPCFDDNLARMQKEGIALYLEAPVAYLLRRLSEDPLVRPLLQEGDPEEVLQKLLVQRREIYEQSRLKIPVEHARIGDFIRLLEAGPN